MWGNIHIVFQFCSIRNPLGYWLTCIIVLVAWVESKMLLKCMSLPMKQKFKCIFGKNKRHLTKPKSHIFEFW